jgi:hypothetical protein
MGLVPEEDKGNLGKLVKLEKKEFLGSKAAQPLKEEDDGNLDIMVRLFLECVYIYHDETPRELDASQFRDVVLATLPRRFTGDETYLSRVPGVVRGYVTYLEDHDVLTDPPGFKKVLDEMDKKFAKAVKKVKKGDRIPQDDALGKQIKKKGEEVGRNDPCPCGSGKKYKKCCLLKK